VFLRNHSDPFFNRLIGTQPNETLFYINKVRSDSSFKGGVVTVLTRMIYFNQFETKENQSVACKEKMMMIPVVICARKDFYLLEAMNKKIQMLLTGGLIQYWNNKDINKRLVGQKAKGGPKILTLHHVSGCFYILLIGWLLSLIFFIGEILKLLKF
jgi:hypothetical protein